MISNFILIASLLIILPCVVESACNKKNNYELRLSVEGKRNLTGQWEKDAKLDFDGPEPPKSWSIDIEEKAANADRFSFSAVARVLGKYCSSNYLSFFPDNLTYTSLYIARSLLYLLN
jgi:hypothetical protein